MEHIIRFSNKLIEKSLVFLFFYPMPPEAAIVFKLGGIRARFA